MVGGFRSPTSAHEEIKGGKSGCKHPLFPPFHTVRAPLSGKPTTRGTAAYEGRCIEFGGNYLPRPGLRLEEKNGGVGGAERRPHPHSLSKCHSVAKQPFLIQYPMKFRVGKRDNRQQRP